MFYRPEDGHGLPHNPFNAIITPRPIGWISTRGTDGRDNLAPYSFFNGLAYEPPQLMFSTTTAKPDRGHTKDSAANAEETGFFCVNIVSEAMTQAMNVSSGPWPRETDEFELAGLARAECEAIPCSRVDGAPASLECRVVQVVPLLGEHNRMVIGEVVGIHLRDDCIVDGIFDVLRYNPLSRLGYRDYTVVRETFSLNRPDQE